MTEQSCCALCGAAGHCAAQCNWNAPGALESIRLPAHGTTIALDEVLAGYLPDDREDVREVIEAYADIQARAAVMLFSGAGLASQQAEQCPQCAGTGYDCPDCIADFEREQVQGELWAVHAQGPDDLYAAFSREDAEKHAAELNALPMPEGISVSAVVVASPWPAAEHWKYLAEQEREHNGALVAQAGQALAGWRIEQAGDRIVVQQLPSGAGYAAAREGASGIAESVLFLLAADLLAGQVGQVPQAWFDVQAERRRQVEAEGFDASHDDIATRGQIARAAGCYALHAGGIGTQWPAGVGNGSALFWPWDKEWWKPKSARENLVRAAALILAEIERLDRAAAPAQGVGHA